MPITISRNTDAPPVISNPLSPEQVDEIWGRIIRSWTERHPDKFLDLLENGVPGKEGAAHGAA